MPAAPQVASLGIRSLSRKSSSPPVPTTTSIEHKHIFFYASMDLPVSPSDVSSENGPSMLDNTFSQTAMAMIRRRMSIGKGDAKTRGHKRKHSLSNHIFGGSSTDLNASSTSKGPSEASGIPASGKPKIVKTFLFQLPLNSQKAPPPSFNLKQEALELAGRERERRSSEEGSNEFGTMGKDREVVVKSKLVDDARVEYKLTARWELGGSLHLWSQYVNPCFRFRSIVLLTCVSATPTRLDAPFVFEPGSDPDSIYAAPAKAKTWTEHPLQASHSSPPHPTPTRSQSNPTRGPSPPIGRSLSFNASSPPFKVVLTLPNPCVVPRDSRDAKTDVQPESLKFFVAYSTTGASARDEQLAQAVRTSAAVKIEMTCTYGFDKNQAAALVLEGAAAGAGVSSGSGVGSVGTGAGAGAGAGAGGTGASSGASTGAGVGVGLGVGASDARADGKIVWKWNEPPTSPLMRHQARRSEDLRGTGTGTGLPFPPPHAKGHRRERSLPDVPMQAEERAITIASIERRGFPHRPKEKPGQKNLPDGLWKGALNLHWWMIPSMEWAGLNVKVRFSGSGSGELKSGKGYN